MNKNATSVRTFEQTDTLFRDALRDPSNLEMDWLWLATQVSRLYEQHYCLMQALRINPHSTLAQQSLARLQTLGEQTVEPCLDIR
jgi:hypothetical protein